MSAPDCPFKGFATLRVSSKRSVHLPRGWSNRLASPMFLCRNHNVRMPCIQVIPLAAWEERPKTDPSRNLHGKKDHGAGFLSEDCRQVHFGPRPRLTLPRTWCEESGITCPGLVMLVGRGTFFDLWSKQNFDHFMKQEI